MADEEKKVRIHPVLDISEDPAINIMDDATFRMRVAKVFNMTAKALAKSYGPFGSSTIISDYPFSHITKDGFSIMKKISFSKDKTVIDDAIKSLIEAPCSRLNYAVGDGTTTAIIAVNSIYQAYLANAQRFRDRNIPPRDVVEAYNRIKDRIIEKIDLRAVRIDNLDHDAMVNAITEVAAISSNNDETIVSLMHDLYDELGCPLIDITKAADGITKKNVINGYRYKAVLTDQLYINNDNYTANIKDLDILIFDHKVTQDTFNEIILPLNDACRSRGRHLGIIAPAYDDVAMRTMSLSLKREFAETRDINLVLMIGKMAVGTDRNFTEDLAMLLNTTIINMGLERDIIKKIKEDMKPHEVVFNLDYRKIPGIRFAMKKVENGIDVIVAEIDNGNYPDDAYNWIPDNDAIRVGFVKNADLTLKTASTFEGFYYDEEMYNKVVMSVSKDLEDSKKKSEALSAVNFEAKDLQRRLFSLRMKLGTIEVGGESQLSQGYLYDAVDDTVKATESAYNNGIISGCSLTTLLAAWDVADEIDREQNNATDREVISIIIIGFMLVYQTLLESRFKNFEVTLRKNNETDLLEIAQEFEDNWGIKLFESVPDDLNGIHAHMLDAANAIINGIEEENISTPAYNYIIYLSLMIGRPLNITTGLFDDKIINSSKTDKEVLKASADLVSLLITGNQFIVADHQ